LRLVIDTNILISALLAGTSFPAQLIVRWRVGRFDLLTVAEQLDELMRVTRYPKIRERLTPALAGRSTTCARSLSQLENCPSPTCRLIPMTTTCWRSPRRERQISW